MTTPLPEATQKGLDTGKACAYLPYPKATLLILDCFLRLEVNIHHPLWLHLN